jgi:two-component system, LuxR family, sensor kinase FixL
MTLSGSSPGWVRYLPERRASSAIDAAADHPRPIALRRPPALPDWAIGVAYLAGYVFLDWLSFIHPLASFGITPWNPGTGLSFALVLLFGWRMVPYLFLAPMLSDVVNLATPLPIGAALASAAAIGAGYTAASLTLLRPALRFDPELRSLRDLVLLMLVAVISAGLVASSYVAIMIAAALLPGADFPTAALHYWVGDVIGIVVVTPFTLIALTRRTMPDFSLEAALQIGAVAAALALIFGLAEEQQFQLFYLLFLPIVWMAVRTGLEGVSVGILLTQLGLIAGVELFRNDPQDLMAFQVLMLILSGTGLVAGALVSQSRRAEQQLRLHRESLAQVARLGNLGEMAAAVAHEINQPLAAGGTPARLVNDTLREGSADPAALAATAEKAAAQIERAAEVVRRLRALVRLDRSARAPCNIERIIRETVALCRPALDQHHIGVRVSVDSGLPLVAADALQIGQTLLNLMRNAIDAVAETRHAGGMITTEATLNGAGEVEVRVADNGPGFPPDFADNPFLPLTSRKAEGLGIGLPLSRSIIEAHGGRLWLDRHARGGDVHFTLPAAQELHHE